VILISTSQSQKIAKEITLKAIENNKILVENDKDWSKVNKKFAEETAKFYKTIFEAVEETSTQMTPK
jgi:hypothetical protein